MNEILASINRAEPKTPAHLPYRATVKNEAAELSPSIFALYLQGMIQSYAKIRRNTTGRNSEQEEAYVMKALNKRFGDE